MDDLSANDTDADSAPPVFDDDRPSTPARLVRIGPFGDLIEANLAAARLHDEGIRASLTGENLAATLGPVYGAAYAGGPFVLVPAADEAAARAIVTSIESARRDRRSAETPACPACDCRSVTPVLHGLRWAALLMFALAFVIAPLTPFGFVFVFAGAVLLVAPTPPAWKCPVCRRRFTAARPAVVAED